MRPKKEYIAVSRHWWDRMGGSSYFSAQVFDIRMTLVKVIPFQYGDNSHAEDTIVSSMIESLYPITIGDQTFPRHKVSGDDKRMMRRMIYFDRNDTTKRDCVAFGKAIVDGEEE